MVPLSAPQFERLGQAITGTPSERGEFYEIGDEVAGFGGFRVVKLNPLKSMGFKITNYQAGMRDARREFTGGAESVIKGGPKTGQEVLRQFLIANEALFNVQKDMFQDINAAQTLGVNSDRLYEEFAKRQIGRKQTGNLFEGNFDPYYPSESIRRRFQEIAEEIGRPNPYEEVEDILMDIYERLSDMNLEDGFDLTLEEYLPTAGGMAQTPMLETPGVNPELVQSPMMQNMNVMQTGLTPTEQALLSPEEQAIRLRQRGMGRA